MRMLTLTCGLPIVLIAGLAHAPALAEEPGLGPSGLLTIACASDIQKFCADKVHDGGVRACLEARKADVAPVCRTALNSRGGGPAPR